MTNMLAARTSELGILTSDTEVLDLVRSGRRSKPVRRLATRLMLDVRGVANRHGFELEPCAEERVKVLLVGVAAASTNRESDFRTQAGPGRAGEAEVRWAVRKLASEVIASTDSTTVNSLTGPELEALIKTHCKWSLPPFCHKN